MLIRIGGFDDQINCTGKNVNERMRIKSANSKMHYNMWNYMGFSYMRIKSKDDLSKLGLTAQEALTPILNDVFKSKRNSVKNQTSKQGRQTKRRTEKTIDGHNYCPWPSSDPAVELHKALEARYGRWDEKGSIVSEMIIPGHDIAFRYDWAHLQAKITIEFDGYSAHMRLDDFNKDRLKQRHAAANGWLPINITHRDVKYNLDNTMTQIDTIVACRSSYNEKVKKKGRTQHVWIPKQ